ncbi:MAG: hypothetical protein II829_04050 [Bacteroidales bacterium]|nr:hypothetical protein [Bacteroidales bacterium]
MKKLMLSVIIVLSMSLASFANANANQFSSNGSQIESIENADPHTKQYQDMKKILDEYEQSVKKATTCEELDNAAITMFVKLMATTENTYDQEMTPEEGEEIEKQMNRIDIDVKQKQQQMGCEPEGEGGEE